MLKMKQIRYNRLSICGTTCYTSIRPMPAERISGKAIAKRIKEETAERVAKLKEHGITPTLAVVLVGDDKPSHTYVGKKEKAAHKVGMDFLRVELPQETTTEQLLAKLEEVQADEKLTGLIVQLPLPEQIDTNRALNAINSEFDVDCLTDVNLGRIVMKTNTIVPPTPGAVISAIRDTGLTDFVGKNVTIIGVGPLVGKPLAVMLMNERMSVTTCNSKTRDTKEKCLSADIIVTGVGRKDILRGDMIPDGAIVIDTGVSFEDGVMYGDVNMDEAMEKASYVTPTPGGTGPITVARLLRNTVILAEQKL